ncbi:MAG: hypothetical protein R3Y19_08105 [Rikenellaceae bacterium]
MNTLIRAYKESKRLIQQSPALLSSQIPNHLLELWTSGSPFRMPNGEEKSITIVVFDIIVSRYAMPEDNIQANYQHYLNSFIRVLALELVSRKSPLSFGAVRVFDLGSYGRPLTIGLSGDDVDEALASIPAVVERHS